MTKNIKSFPLFDSYDRKYNKRFKSKNNFWLCRKIITRKLLKYAEKIYMQIYIVQLVQERKIYRKKFFLSGFTTFRYQRRIKLS